MAEERQCMCTTPEITIKLNKQGPQGKVGPQGEPGFSPYIGVANDTPSQYILRITNEDGEYLTPNLKANIPLGGSAGTVLTKNSDVNGDCSFKALPYASTSQQGVVYLATTEEALLGDPDYAITGEVLLGVLANKIGNGTITLTQGGVTKGTFTTNQAGNTSIALDGVPANMVTTDTDQEISGNKTFTGGIKLTPVYSTIDIPYRGSNYTIFGSTEGQGNVLISIIGNGYNGNRTQINGSYIDFFTSDNRLPRTFRNNQYYDIVDAGSIGSYLTTYTTGDPLYIDTGNVIKMYYDSGKGLYVNGQSLAVRVDGTTIDFDSSGNLSYVGSAGPSYSAGSGIDITNDTISIDDTVVATQNDISNMATTDTTQTITGAKTFSQPIYNTASIYTPQIYAGKSNVLTSSYDILKAHVDSTSPFTYRTVIYSANDSTGGTDGYIKFGNEYVNTQLVGLTVKDSNGNTYLTSANIGSYIPTINGGNANA